MPTVQPVSTEDRSWYAEMQLSLARELARIPLIALEGHETQAAASDVDLPLGDEKMGWQDVHRFAVDLDRSRSPLASIAEDCSVIAAQWTSPLGEEDAR